MKKKRETIIVENQFYKRIEASIAYRIEEAFYDCAGGACTLPKATKSAVNDFHWAISKLHDAINKLESIPPEILNNKEIDEVLRRQIPGFYAHDEL
jgi:hypothetical protein